MIRSQIEVPSVLRHLHHRPSLLVGLAFVVVAFGCALPSARPVTAALIGWDVGVVAYGVTFLILVRKLTPERLRQDGVLLDEGRWAMLVVTIAAAIISLGAIVLELAQIHGKHHAGWLTALAGATVVLSWFFVHTIFTTHYAHDFWRSGGLLFPGNDRPGIGEFFYFSFCMAVASQVSDVSTQSAGMRRLVLAHSMVSYLFNTAIIALGVNIAASLAG